MNSKCVCFVRMIFLMIFTLFTATGCLKMVDPSESKVAAPAGRPTFTQARLSRCDWKEGETVWVPKYQSMYYGSQDNSTYLAPEEVMGMRRSIFGTNSFATVESSNDSNQTYVLKRRGYQTSDTVICEEIAGFRFQAGGKTYHVGAFVNLKEIYYVGNASWRKDIRMALITKFIAETGKIQITNLNGIALEISASEIDSNLTQENPPLPSTGVCYGDEQPQDAKISFVPIAWKVGGSFVIPSKKFPLGVVSHVLSDGNALWRSNLSNETVTVLPEEIEGTEVKFGACSYRVGQFFILKNSAGLPRRLVVLIGVNVKEQKLIVTAADSNYGASIAKVSPRDILY